MWLQHPLGGFASIVYKDRAGKPSKAGPKAIISVRFRRPKDAAVMFPDLPYVATPHGDYAGRVFASREQVAWAVAKMILDGEYTNVKGAIPLNDNPLHDAMHDAWTVFGRLQEGGPYGHGRFLDRDIYGRPQKKAVGGVHVKHLGGKNADDHDWRFADDHWTPPASLGPVATETSDPAPCALCGEVRDLTEDELCNACAEALSRPGV